MYVLTCLTINTYENNYLNMDLNILSDNHSKQNEGLNSDAYINVLPIHIHESIILF